MASWEVSDELDARLRSFLEKRGGDVTAFVEQVIGKQLDYEGDPDFHQDVEERIRRGMEDVEAGRVVNAKDAMREIADEYGFRLPE